MIQPSEQKQTCKQLQFCRKKLFKNITLISGLLFTVLLVFLIFRSSQSIHSLILFNPEKTNLTNDQIDEMKSYYLEKDYNDGYKQYYDSIQSEIAIIKINSNKLNTQKYSIVVNGLEPCNRSTCEQSINSILRNSKASQVIWITKAIKEEQKNQTFSLTLFEYLKDKKIQFELSVEIVDSLYNFILKHLNPTHKWLLCLTNRAILQQVKFENLVHRSSLAIILSGNSKHSDITEDVNLLSISKLSALSNAYFFQIQLLKIITPLSFAYQDIYPFEQLIIIPALALSQLAHRLEVVDLAIVKFIPKSESEISINSTEFRFTKLPTSSDHFNNHICFVSCPVVPEKNSPEHIVQYLSVFQQLEKKEFITNKYTSIYIGLTYQKSSNLSTTIEKVLKLRSLGTAIRLRIRPTKSVLSVQMYEVTRAYCPENSTLFSSRLNVHPDIEKIRNSVYDNKLCRNDKLFLLSNFVNAQGRVSNLQPIQLDNTNWIRQKHLHFFNSHFYYAQISCSFLIKSFKLSVFKWQELEFYESEGNFAISMLQRARQNYSFQAKPLYRVVFDRESSEKQKEQFSGLRQRDVQKNCRQVQIQIVPYSQLNNYGYKINASDVMPKIIHQIFLSNFKQPTPVKVALQRTLQNTNPDFEYKLWTWDNVTRQNFPLTYDGIVKVVERSNQVNINYLAIAVDMMRIQVLYKYGGFYFDFKVEGKKSLRPFLKYQQLHCFISNQGFSINMIGSVKGNRNFYHILKQYSSRDYKIFPAGNFETTGGSKLISVYKDSQIYSQVFNFRQFAFQGMWPCMYESVDGPLQPGQQQFTGIATFESHFQYRVRLPCNRDMQKYAGYYDMLGRSYYFKNNLYS